MAVLQLKNCYVLLFIAFVFPLVPARGAEIHDSCLSCHGSAQKMREAGYPHFTMTQKEVEDQSGMTASCADCHMGNPASGEKEEAHRGMGRLLLVRKQGLRAETANRRLPLEVGGSPSLRLKFQVEKGGRRVVDPSVNTLLYQDRRADTLSQDFPFMKKSCGKCHSGEFAQFRASNMGRNAKQREYRSWNDKGHGPHNCGVWFGDNCRAIADATAVPFARATCDLNQRQCNVCHVGCLDCHYDPRNGENDAKKGIHSFNRIPRPESCYGGGRGPICHAGPEERRRGAGYFGGPFSHPEGMEADVHLAAKVGCLDCHENRGNNRTLGHGTIKRQAVCDKCHAAVVRSHAASRHRRLACEACHIRNVGGYQGTYWGPGKLAGSDTPYNKYNNYYGIMKEPILIRDQHGRWIPVKPYPLAVLNQKDAHIQPGLHWRYPPGLPDLERTDDAWGYVGTFSGLPENNKALLWIQMDKLSHKYGKSRTCDSCHGSMGGEQRQEIRWEFSDAGAFPFKGSHTLVANGKGLFIMDLRADEPIEPLDGYKLSSFAPWFYLKDKWAIPGDFALPLIKDLKEYERLRTDPARAVQEGVLHSSSEKRGPAVARPGQFP